MFISDAFAQAGEAAASFPSGTLIQLAVIFLIFYFLLIRPQQKKVKQHEAMLHSLKKGDKIITGGGIVGKIVGTDEFELEIEIAPNTTIKILRSTVRDLAVNEALRGKPEAKKAETTVAIPHKNPANSNKK